MEVNDVSGLISTYEVKGYKINDMNNMPLWWNRQTRLTQNQVSKDVSVQVRLGAPFEENYGLSFT